MSNVVYLPWDEKTAADLRATAFRLTRHEDYPHRRDVDNCGACALTRQTHREAPNYAGWLRLYVAMGRPVMRKHYEAEIAGTIDNPRYQEALQRDIATFGIRWFGE